MLKLVGGVTVVLDLDRSTSRAEVEDVLVLEGFVGGASPVIHVTPYGDRTQLTIGIPAPMTELSGRAELDMPAAGVLESLASALRQIAAGPRVP
jgi:hypothetical protein